MKRLVNKKGQLTIFIIVAVLIIAIIAVLFFFRPEPNTQGGSAEVSPVYTKVMSCVESTTEEGIFYIALQGGYYIIPEEIIASYNLEKSSYYYINSRIVMPSIEKIERELEYYIVDKIKYCVDFDSLEDQGFNLKEGDLKVSVAIIEEEINVNADYPLTVKKGEDTSILGEFKADISLDVNKLYLALEEIVNSYSKNPGLVCMTCLDETSGKYNVEIKATPISEDNAIWFSVLDSENNLKWRFVVEK